MKRRLRNITITLDQDLARSVRLAAAREETSVSRLLAGILKDRMREEDTYERAMRRALARKPFLKTQGRYPSRQEDLQADQALDGVLVVNPFRRDPASLERR